MSISSTHPPAHAVMPGRRSDAPQPGARIPSHYRWCVGCGSDHEHGLHLRVHAGEGLTVRGDFTVTEDHQGAPGLAHGGIISTAFDEVLGALNWLLGAPVVTARLEVDFTRPVPVGTTMRIEAEVTGMHGRKVYSAARGLLPDGTLAAAARALFIQVPFEHFLRNGEPHIVQQAIDDRAKGAPAWRRDASNGGVDVNP